LFYEVACKHNWVPSWHLDSLVPVNWAFGGLGLHKLLRNTPVKIE